MPPDQFDGETWYVINSATNNSLEIQRLKSSFSAYKVIRNHFKQTSTPALFHILAVGGIIIDTENNFLIQLREEHIEGELQWDSSVAGLVGQNQSQPEERLYNRLQNELGIQKKDVQSLIFHGAISIDEWNDVNLAYTIKLKGHRKLTDIQAQDHVDALKVLPLTQLPNLILDHIQQPSALLESTPKKSTIIEPGIGVLLLTLDCKQRKYILEQIEKNPETKDLIQFGDIIDTKFVQE